MQPSRAIRTFHYHVEAEQHLLTINITLLSKNDRYWNNIMRKEDIIFWARYTETSRRYVDTRRWSLWANFV